MAVPVTPLQSKRQPRLTPSAECRLPPPPEPLTDSQAATLDALRTHIHTTVANTHAQRRWADDHCLVRYLKSKKWNLNESKQAVQDSILWREQYKPDIPDKNSIWIETAPGKLYVSGFDMESRPLLYMKPRLENTAASPAQIRHVVFHLELAIALMPEGVQNLCIIIDFAGSSMTKNPGVAVAREIIHVLGSHYPERLGKAYIIHAPWFFFPFYKLISPFIDPVTKAKINFVDMKKQKPRSAVSTPSSAAASEIDLSAGTVTTPVHKKGSSSASAGALSSSSSGASDNVNLLDMIPEDMLEQAFGGTSDYEYDQETYWNTAEKVLADARNALEKDQTPDVDAVAS
ncbi:CRAL-TRIO domain-containing protein [Gamsiella multidivaricata]|uniref:CRAL-TRIO domain-containing protein n=1 Tax=Gamsiella multidivaricata TaxID=101098 RepID=UPI00221EBFB2|nr:CRAL-TRIO domain-containing protein [Gamsiella multidivaricata]KAG0369250.1 hypothetical protein BGZ54_010470 [Gamsiella multidivaricata]KAI7818223.1 CRAL-TRIO domain-containing protein [Gamsiella multidivaricata]